MVRPLKIRFNRVSAFVAFCAMNLYLVTPPLLQIASPRLTAHGLDTTVLYSLLLSVLWLTVIHFSFPSVFTLHIALSPLYLVTALDLYLIYNFDTRLTSSQILIAFTDFADATSFLSMYWPSLLTFLIVFLALLVAALMLVRAMTIQASRPLLLLSVASLILAYTAPTLQQIPAYGLPRALRNTINHDLSTPFGFLSQLGSSLAILSDTRANTSLRELDAPTANKTGLHDVNEVHLFVIGESARPDHWSINGYHRKTTPKLSTLRNLYSLSNVITTAPHTAVAVPSMLSLWSILDYASIERHRSIIYILRKAGYRTFWLSTQELSAWAGIMYAVAGESSVKRFYDRADDSLLLRELDRIFAALSQPFKIVVFIHSRGSHGPYADRYPDTFSVFADADADREQRTIDEYDNSILYTDWFLTEIVRRLDLLPCVSTLLYASDHGENLFDPPHRHLGHGIGNEHDLRCASAIWLSDTYLSARPDLRGILGRNSGAKLSLANISHTFLDLTMVSSDRWDPTRSLASNSFKEGPRHYRVRGRLLTFAEEESDASSHR